MCACVKLVCVCVCTIRVGILVLSEQIVKKIPLEFVSMSAKQAG